MRFALLLLVSLVLLLSSCFFGSTLEFGAKDAAGQPNLVPNGDLELGLYGVYKRENLPEHWMVLQNPRDPDAVAWEDSDGHIDSRCLRLYTGDTKLSLISDSFDISPQSAYYNRLWIKTDHDIDEEIECRFIAFDMSGETVNQFTEHVIPSTKWTCVEFNAVFFKKAARYGRIMVILPPQTKRRIWVDAFGCYNVTATRN